MEGERGRLPSLKHAIFANAKMHTRSEDILAPPPLAKQVDGNQKKAKDRAVGILNLVKI